MCLTQPQIKKRKQSDKKDLSTKKLLNLISDAKKWGVEIVWLVGGGEPLLRKDIRIIASRVKTLGLKGLMTTNGVLLDEHISRLLIELQWDQVIVSVDAATPETYEKIRGLDYLEKISGNIRNLSRVRKELRSEKPEIIIYTVVLPENYNALDKIVEFGNHNGADKVIFGNAFPENPASMLTSKQEEEAKTCYRKAADTAKRLGIKTNVGIFLKKREYLENRLCTKPWTQMGVMFDGKIQPCALSKEIMGDVNKNSLMEIWRSKEYQDLRKRRVKNEFDEWCKHCDIYDQHMFRFSQEFYRHPISLIKYLNTESQV
jgi:radical SAM protein with 4Fe4S-binding SPASM domain